MKNKIAACCLAVATLAGGCATPDMSVSSPEPGAAPERSTGSHIPRRRLTDPAPEARVPLPR